MAESTLTSIVSSYISLFGANRLLAGLASPIFFDGLAAAAHLEELEGGATTIIAMILKNCIRPETGLAVVGGKRPSGYKVPEELDRVAEIFGFSESILSYLKYASRMVAKVDSAAIQDGFELYLHLMIVSHQGEWTIIQQGVKPVNLVRRYHWISRGLRSFVEEPHSGIVSTEREDLVLDMTAEESAESRKVCVEAVNSDLRSLRRFLQRLPSGQLTLTDLDAREERSCPFDIPRVRWATLLEVNRRGPRDFEELLSLHGVGAAMVRFLAAASIELYGVYPSLSDPAILFREVPSRLGEDRWLYELVEAIKASNLSLTEKKKAIGRLSAVFRWIEGAS